MNEDGSALVVSTNGGRISIRIGGQWVMGHVEHGGNYSTTLTPNGSTRGYTFISDAGEVCVLCVDMRVKRPQ